MELRALFHGSRRGGIKRKRFACAISWNETTAMEKKLQVAPLPLRDFPLHENENEFETRTKVFACLTFLDCVQEVKLLIKLLSETRSK
jgi:hypothetical protein